MFKDCKIQAVDMKFFKIKNGYIQYEYNKYVGSK
jgi:hypothetical protein